MPTAGAGTVVDVVVLGGAVGAVVGTEPTCGSSLVGVGGEAVPVGGVVTVGCVVTMTALDGSSLAPVPGAPLLRGMDGGPAWGDAVVICPWTIHRCYGDLRLLEERFA